jgi:hypothetical protein
MSRLLLVLFLVASTPALADDVFRFGDDIFAAGAGVTIGAVGLDDVFAAGERVELTAPIAGTAHLMGRRVSSTAEIGGGLYAAGADVGVSAPVAGDAALAGYDVTVEGAVGGDLRAAARHLRVAAPVAGTALLTGETVTIDAAIDGDAAVTAEDLAFGPGGRIGGRLSLYGHNAGEIAVPATVAPAERIERHPGEPRPGTAGSAAAAEGPGWLAGIVGLALGVLVLAVLAFAVALFAPNAVERLAALTAARPFHTFWIGFLTLSALIGATVLAVATVVGILVAPALILAAGVLGFLGYLVAVYLLGRAVWSWVGRFPPDTLPERALAALVGAVLVTVIALVPFLGWISLMVLALTGLGAMSMATLRPAFRS